MNEARPDAGQLVPGPSAGRWDLWRRLGQLVAVLLAIAGVALIATGTLPLLAVAIPTGALVVAALVVTIVCGVRASATMKLERAAGYSTVLDAAGFEFRDPKTLVVLRPRDAEPAGQTRRSLALGILGVKPGTVLAKRLDDPSEGK